MSMCNDTHRNAGISKLAMRSTKTIEASAGKFPNYVTQNPRAITKPTATALHLHMRWWLPGQIQKESPASQKNAAKCVCLPFPSISRLLEGKLVCSLVANLCAEKKRCMWLCCIACFGHPVEQTGTRPSPILCTFRRRSLPHCRWWSWSESWMLPRAQASSYWLLAWKNTLTTRQGRAREGMLCWRVLWPRY